MNRIFLSISLLLSLSPECAFAQRTPGGLAIGHKMHAHQVGTFASKQVQPMRGAKSTGAAGNLLSHGRSIALTATTYRPSDSLRLVYSSGRGGDLRPATGAQPDSAVYYLHHTSARGWDIRSFDVSHYNQQR